VIEVRATPGARTSDLNANPERTWTAHAAAPPVDGPADEALMALVAKHLGCAKLQMSIKSRAAGRHKWLMLISAE